MEKTHVSPFEIGQHISTYRDSPSPVEGGIVTSVRFTYKRCYVDIIGDDDTSYRDIPSEYFIGTCTLLTIDNALDVPSWSSIIECESGGRLTKVPIVNVLTPVADA